MCIAIGLVTISAKGADPVAAGALDAGRVQSLLGKPNLTAWCIVPFDGKHRNPEQRAAMLQRLGIKRLAYDWRGKDIPTFDAELAALKKHDVQLGAFWLSMSRDPANDDRVKAVLDFIRRNRVKLEIWVMVNQGGLDQLDQQGKVDAMAKPVAWLADEAARLGCRVGLYNHGGWYGDPVNQIAIIEKIDRPNVGIVYNQHHGHGDVDRFGELLQKMMPHLLAVNLNGMDRAGDQRGRKLLPLSAGELDEPLLRQLVASGYDGPVGILGHTQDDVELRLADNLAGLAWLRQKLIGQNPGPRPTMHTYTKP
ncbi:TIM barrel protein [Planctomycetales bacterium ZRK34]|nr:TIM barrel protein [Planctomycetales bacterium ZRK34]